jgi:hypothetical protein
MTLLVAGVSEQTIWMVADTLVTGPMGRRHDEHQIKVVPSEDRKALIGFAGEQMRGAEAIEHARKMPAGASVLTHLLEVQRSYPIDFAYGYFDHSGPHLFCLSGGSAKEVPVLHLGVESAFEQFQTIRHRDQIDPVPKAIATFFMGTRSKDKLPEALLHSVTAMLRLFSERSERDVGGAAIPYLLGTSGAFLCGYGYSVSDPITPELRSGDLIPHGTAPAGGFGLSVTEFDHEHGIIVYWLQKPGGSIYLRRATGFEVIELDGPPSQFRAAGQAKLGHPIEIMFGDTDPKRPPDSITVLSDQSGKHSIAVARYGNDLQFCAIDVSSDFRTKLASIDMSGESELSCSTASVAVADDLRSATLQFHASSASSNEITLSASQLDELIFVLGTARAKMAEQLPTEPLTEALTREAVVIDPIWRTNFPPHQSLDGLLLRMRHPGLGWLTFLLPHHECMALAEWLSKNAIRK